MKNYKVSLTIFCAVLNIGLWGANVQADLNETQQYVVQIASYRGAVPAYVADELKRQGYQVAIEKNNVYRRLLVTEFATKASADKARNMLREAGFSDAFVKRVGSANDNIIVEDSRTNAHSHSVRHTATMLRDSRWNDMQAQLNSLTSEQREQTVLLDGRLHIKRGNDFIPLHKLVK